MLKQNKPSFREKYLLPILYSVVFLGYCGANIGGAPRTQMYELIICQNQYGNITLGEGKDSICKNREVQEELAFLQGMDRLIGGIPTIIAIPWSFFGEKYGRSLALSLALAGLALGELWSTLICWFSNVLPIRLILLGPAFQIVGGGSVIFSTMLHIIAAEHVSEDMRTSVFFFIKGTCAASIIAEQVGSSTFMEYNYLWTPMLIGIGMVVVAAGVAAIIPNSLPEPRVPDDFVDVMTPLLPEETSRLEGPFSGRTQATAKVDDNDSAWRRLKVSISQAISGAHVIVGNSQLLLLLLIGFLSDLSEGSFNMIFLLYVSKRFGWDFARVNYLAALSAGVQFAFLIALLPVLSNLLISRYHLSAHVKDRFIAVCSLVVFITTSLFIGLSTKIWMLIIGVILFPTACGMQSVIRSIITSNISSTDISIVYSVFTILHVLSQSIAGPVYSGAFTVGLRLGGFWMGLPYFVGAGLSVLALGGMVFLKEKKTYEPLPVDDPIN